MTAEEDGLSSIFLARKRQSPLGMTGIGLSHPSVGMRSLILQSFEGFIQVKIKDDYFYAELNCFIFPFFA